MKWTKRRILAVVGVAVLAGTAAFCSPGYVIRAGIEEAKILTARRPIDQVIASPDTDGPTREKLQLVRSVRTFAHQELGLDVGDSYTTFAELGSRSDTLLMVVTASSPVAFEPYTWWFPIVGRVPYKGFFDPEAALELAAELDREGYDTHVRPSSAFSTLGWFNDPLLSTLLFRNDVALAATVIHEVTHNTVFVTDQVAFNESVATFVGDVGAAEYFCGLEGEDSERCRHARARWQDRILFSQALQRLISALENVYDSEGLSFDQKLAARDTVLARWRAGYQREVVPQLQVGFMNFHERSLNNASLIGFRLYARELELFDRVYRALGLPLDQAVHRMVEAAEASPDAPFEAVRRLAEL